MKAGDIVRDFYNNFGWRNSSAGENALFRTFPESFHTIYNPGIEERIRLAFAGRSGHLLIVGSGDMPQTHLDVADQFSAITCMDISELALEASRQRLGDKGRYLLDSIVDTQEVGEQFDAVLCAFVLFHIDASEQATAVRQMMRLTKAGGRVVIIYANPNSPMALPGELARKAKFALTGKGFVSPKGAPAHYYHAHPLRWWKQFSASARLTLLPSQVIGSRPAQALLRSDSLARGFFRFARWLELRYPQVAARVWQYPMAILDKNSS